MLASRTTLSVDDLAAVAELERRVVAADGGRLKLEWGALRGRAGSRPSDFLWVVDDRLVGFLGVYSFGDRAELAGMVDPDFRRKGVGGRLLDAAADECRSRGLGNVLVIVPRPSAAGAALARGRGGSLDHAEHALVLSGEPADGPTDPAVTTRAAAPDDAGEVARLLEAGFGWAPDDVAGKMSGFGSWTLLVERGTRAIGTLRLSEDGEFGFVHGFVIDPVEQGRGIGRDVLRRACRELRGRGLSRVALEVAVENERALGLYTSIGFQPVLTEDYYRIAL
ncbi:GNAT family N-acetyltransferase [uncultured Jatrophihabitans sp.]|uniref:GNAT family N-acetyltransferase n=1 Tax=uncultured Jatrophihabitans sp. TaxID=1610747 RepID=UPI0035CBA705